MSRLLVAVTPEVQPLMVDALAGHELIFPEDLQRAVSVLKEERVDLVFCGVLFDESRMFDLLTSFRVESAKKDLPFLCMRQPGSLMAHPMCVSSIQVAARAMGANDFLDYADREWDKSLLAEIRQTVQSWLPAANFVAA